jgi:hypothetical protein
MLAEGFAALLAAAGIAVPHPVDLTCSGGRQVTAAHHVAWLVLQGIPWLGRRGREFLPYAAVLITRDLLGHAPAPPSSPAAPSGVPSGRVR